jgi:hypothetical protein
MATTTTAPFGDKFDYAITKTTTVAHAVSNPTRNVRGGPATFYSGVIDNTGTGTPTAVWLKLYDIIDETFVAGTAKPCAIIPVAASVELGVACTGGFDFDNGISYLASKENGDTMTAAPDTQVDFRFIST